VQSPRSCVISSIMCNLSWYYPIEAVGLSRSHKRLGCLAFQFFFSYERFWSGCLRLLYWTKKKKTKILTSSSTVLMPRQWINFYLVGSRFVWLKMHISALGRIERPRNSPTRIGLILLLLFIKNKMPVLSQENERSCVYVLSVSILPLFPRYFCWIF
jgi:hypothetical protein